MACFTYLLNLVKPEKIYISTPDLDDVQFAFKGRSQFSICLLELLLVIQGFDEKSVLHSGSSESKKYQAISLLQACYNICDEATHSAKFNLTSISPINNFKHL